MLTPRAKVYQQFASAHPLKKATLFYHLPAKSPHKAAASMRLAISPTLKRSPLLCTFFAPPPSVQRKHVSPPVAHLENTGASTTPSSIHASTFVAQSRLAKRYANARLPARLSQRSRLVHAPLTQIAWSSPLLPHRIHILGLLLSPILFLHVKIRQVQHAHAAFRFYAVIQLLVSTVHGSHFSFHSRKRS